MELPTLNYDQLVAKWHGIITLAGPLSQWTAPEELAWLAELASQCAIVLEVGAYKGKSCKVMAHACPGRVLSVDRFDDHTEEDFKRNLKDELASDKVTLLAMESGQAADLIKDGSLDAVFIDASHDQESVERDIGLWLPKVKPGGVLCGHDFEKVDNGVALAVKKKLPGYVITQHTIWAWVKMP